MQQYLINERLILLRKSFQLSARTFNATIGEKLAITQNYVGARNATPGADYLKKVMTRFEGINPTWLSVGEGEPFKEGSAPTQNQTTISGEKNTLAVAGTNGKAIQNNYPIADCEKERASIRAERNSLAKQVELLHGQFSTKNALIASKEETIELLRTAFNRPN